MPERRLDEALRRAFGWEAPRETPSSLDRARHVFFGKLGRDPRPFQEQAIDRIAGGANVLLVAATAQGKTEAVIVPIAARLLDAGRETTCCYVAPTRALLNDLHNRLANPLLELGLRAVVKHGDRPFDADEEHVDLLLTTPESLDILVGQEAAVIKRIRIVVVDEVHQLYGTPRGAHIVSLLERLKWSISRTKHVSLQRVALSATVADGQGVAAWLAGSDTCLDVVGSGGQRNIEASAGWCANEHEAARWITDSGHAKVLVFVNSRARCETMAEALESASTGEVLVHYSDLGTSEREYVERRFRQSARAICVATGTLELGIDIGSIDAVALVDPPFSVQAFLQRTGRAARTSNTVPLMLAARDEVVLAHQLALLALAQRGEVEGTDYPEWYSVLAQQVLTMTASNPKVRIFEKVPTEVFNCWPWFDTAAATDLLGGLAQGEWLRREEDLRSYRQGPNLALAVEQWGVFSNIRGASGGGTPLVHGQRRIGGVQLPGGAMVGDVIRYGGRYWEVRAASDKGIRVELTGPTKGAKVPRWSGGGPGGMTHLVAQEMRALFVAERESRAELDDQSRRRWERLRKRTGRMPAGEKVVWEYGEGGRRTYYTFAGSLENELLRLVLGQTGQEARRGSGMTLGGAALTSTQALTFAETGSEVVQRVAAEHWRSLQGWVASGPFFEQLPVGLRRKEVLAQVNQKEVLERVGRERVVAVVNEPVFSEV